MFGKSPDRKYRDYLDWFETQISDESKWSTLRNDRDCANWADQDSKPFPYAKSEALFKMIDPLKFVKPIQESNARHAAMRQDLSQYINADPKQGKLNPEYLKRFEDTEKLRAQLKAYAGGDAGAASDELFRLSKEAQDKGEVWQPISYVKEEISVKEDLPDRSLANKFLHQLWRWGFPVHNFIKKELDVEEASRIERNSHGNRPERTS